MAKNKASDAVAPVVEGMNLMEFLGQFVDPTNEQAVRIEGNTVIINTTQVPKSNLGELLAFVGPEITVICVSTHPSEHKLV